MSARLTFSSGTPAHGEFVLGEGPIAIGRHEARDLVLTDDVVSRHHATIFRDGGSFVLRDEGSTNGTFVNDRKIGEQVLQMGDVIEFGLDGPTARFDDGSVGAVTKPIGRESVATEEEPGPSQELTCVSCGASLRVAARELASAANVYVILDRAALPPACPECGRRFDAGDLAEMIP